jgi:hypothetical protein
VVHDGSVHIVYGQGDYTQAQADLAQPPATLPGLLAAYASLVAKIEIIKNAAAFLSIQSAWETTFVPATVTSHNDLSGIQGGAAGDYYHITGTQATDLTDGGYSVLHYHATDRARANHTGTQLSATISDFVIASLQSGARILPGDAAIPDGYDMTRVSYLDLASYALDLSGDADILILE